MAMGRGSRYYRLGLPITELFECMAGKLSAIKDTFFKGGIN